jgi:glutathione peroxidase-family protein
VENWYKIKVKKKDPNKISAVKPHQYSARFTDFMSKEVFINQNDPVYRQLTREEKKEEVRKHLVHIDEYF